MILPNIKKQLAAFPGTASCFFINCEYGQHHKLYIAWQEHQGHCGRPAKQNHHHEPVKRDQNGAQNAGRTRHSHAMLDGEQVENEEKFSNSCRFPGDPQGAPA